MPNWTYERRRESFCENRPASTYHRSQATPSSSSMYQSPVVNEWVAGQSKAPVIEIEAHGVTASDVVVPTTDTVRSPRASPRELTRWIRGVYEAIRPLEVLSVEGLVRVWAHEALGLFQDRLVTEEDKLWTDQNIDSSAMEALGRPILFSNWTSKNYIPFDREILREYTKARLCVSYEVNRLSVAAMSTQTHEGTIRLLPDRLIGASFDHWNFFIPFSPPFTAPKISCWLSF
ncbi:hypothetical protein FB45DRAFT_1037934 [Roridomyces roridus]|uniref:Dynein 2 heavy chain 1 cytoplasmic ATPase lid domain-containing protein n=1 Tax=Roridomyces roridus TaxID=1738132 RepID=A0AAD7B4D1_9AGAR|nr:hypothetical protein FB45DRAFT_1037934 [Roridomyces roridus]